MGCRDALLPQFNAESGGTSGNGHSATISVNASHGHAIYVGNVGGSLSHENRMPYEVVTRWKRIA